MKNYPGKKYWWDKLSKYTLGIGVILCITKISIIIGIPLIIIAFLRTLSSNVEKRIKENEAFERFLVQMNSKFNEIIHKFRGGSNELKKGYKKKREDRKYMITVCPKCNQKLRLPKRKGTLIVTCSKCNNKFEFKN